MLLAGLDAVSAGLLEQATSVNKRKIDNMYNARERMIFPSNSKLVEAKTVIEGGQNVQMETGRIRRSARPPRFYAFCSLNRSSVGAAEADCSGAGGVAGGASESSPLLFAAGAFSPRMNLVESSSGRPSDAL
jgi:hypothetical protein